MNTDIKPKEVTAIISSLIGGVVPRIGIQHIAVGRTKEIDAFIQSLNEVKNGHSVMKFWIGDYGSGKSFMLHLLNTVAIKQKFVVTKADFTPDNRLYSNDGKGRALFSAIIDNLAIQTKPDGGALQTLLEKWIEQIINKTAQQYNFSIKESQTSKHQDLIKENLMLTIRELTDIGGNDFGEVIIKYYEGFINNDDLLQRNALKWLKGEYSTKTEARQDLGIRDIINDHNYYDMLKNYCKLFVSIGYSGFMINLDEAVNLYKIQTSAIREKNYEKLLTIYNDCLQGKVSNFFINIAATNTTLENERRGLFSYGALKSRLETNKFETSEIRDFAQPVIKLHPIGHNEVFALLKNLKKIFDIKYDINISLTDEQIQLFMEVMLNKPGAKEFLTPREIIRDFLNALNIIRQNPETSKESLFDQIVIKNECPSETNLDDIKEL